MKKQKLEDKLDSLRPASHTTIDLDTLHKLGDEISNYQAKYKKLTGDYYRPGSFWPLKASGFHGSPMRWRSGRAAGVWPCEAAGSQVFAPLTWRIPA